MYINSFITAMSIAQLLLPVSVTLLLLEGGGISSLFYFYIFCLSFEGFIINVKVKVKITLEQATKAQRGSRGIALFFL